MEILINFILLTLFCFFTSCLSKFIDFCFNDGNIFSKYYSYILNFETKHPMIFKILGGCVFCFGTWVYIILFILVGILPINLLILGLGVNYIFIKHLI